MYWRSTPVKGKGRKHSWGEVKPQCRPYKGIAGLWEALEQVLPPGVVLIGQKSRQAGPTAAEADPGCGQLYL